MQTWGRETENYYGELIYTPLFTCCYKGGVRVHTQGPENKTAHTLWQQKHAHEDNFVKKTVCRKYRLSLALIQPLTRYSWVVLKV